MCCSRSANVSWSPPRTSNSTRLVRAGGQDPVRVSERHHVVIGAMHEQHRAAHPGDGIDRRDVVETMADRLLYVAQHVAPDGPLRDSLRRQPPPHHRRRMGERRHAHDPGDFRSARRGKAAPPRRLPNARTGRCARRRCPLVRQASRRRARCPRRIEEGRQSCRRRSRRDIVHRGTARRNPPRAAAARAAASWRRCRPSRASRSSPGTGRGCPRPARSAIRAGGVDSPYRCAPIRSQGRKRPARNRARSAGPPGWRECPGAGGRAAARGWRPSRRGRPATARSPPSQPPSAAHHRRSRMPGVVE